MEYEEIKDLLARKLPPARYRHTLGVVETAVMLAERYQADVEKVRLAALLHDCARVYQNEELLEQARLRGIAMDMVYRKLPLLLHAPVGAMMAQEEFGVQDQEVLQAIAVHTVGTAGMGTVAKVLIIADAIEPGRNYPGIEQLRSEVANAGVNLNLACLHCLEHKMLFVIQSKCLLHSGAVDARNELLLNLSN